MLKILKISFFVLCLFWAQPVVAQEQLSVRSGEHEGYSRLVFDWDGDVSYQAEETPQGIELRFNRAATIPENIGAANISALQVTSADPLNVRIIAPDRERFRTLKVGNRVVVDIYGDAPAQQQVRTEVSPQVQRNPEPPAMPPQEDLAQAEANIPDNLRGVAARLGLADEFPQLRTNAQNVQNDEMRSGEEEEEPSSSAEIVRETLPPTLRKQESDSDAATLFTLSSTSAIGLAVFEYAGRLHIMTNRPDVAVRPQLSGANIEYFQPVETVRNPQGRLFLTRTMPGEVMRAQGSGLLWNIIVGGQKDERSPIKPVRVDVPSETRARGGRLIWPMKTAAKVLDIEHPVTKEPLKIVTVDRADDFAGKPQSFVDFDVFPSIVGLAIRPKVDDLAVEITPRGVEVSRPDGLSILPDTSIASVEEKKPRIARPRDPNERTIYNFAEWEMGGLDALNQNRNIIISGMGDMTEDAQIESLITLAKMNLASGRGAEALGFLNYASQKMPELIQNPEFLALRGAAKAFDWKTDWALSDFNNDILDPYKEIGLWRAFVLADLGDWQQAYEVLPKDFLALLDYPSMIRNRLGVVLTEVYLRGGELKKAENLFTLIEEGKDPLNAELDAALQYLKGEFFRQKDDFEQTKALWEPLTEGPDDLYRVKAGLALTRLLVDKNQLSPRQAIDSLERLRYAWRGDELEAQVNYWLGRTYFEAGEYIKGLKILRNAAGLVPNTILGRRILGDMQSLFTEFFLSPSLKDVSPLDAVALYEEFTELVPTGIDGSKLIEALAEHLVRTDLLTRAGNLLQHQIDHRLEGEKAIRTAMRLAAIRLIDNKPALALNALNRVETLMRSAPEESKSRKRLHDIALLRARALSQQDKTYEALEILAALPKDRDVNRLRADIAWQAGYWDDASFALEDVIIDENISLTRPLSDQHAMLILQQATAMNLSSDRIGLANMREKYADLMAQTTKGRMFDVITRPRQNAGLADRDTLLSTVSEVDLFEGFLNSYKDVQPPSN